METWHGFCGSGSVTFVALLAFVGVYQLHSDPIAIYTMLAWPRAGPTDE